MVLVESSLSRVIWIVLSQACSPGVLYRWSIELYRLGLISSDIGCCPGAVSLMKFKISLIAILVTRMLLIVLMVVLEYLVMCVIVVPQGLLS